MEKSFYLNGRLFVRGASALVETLFQPTGTATGYYATRNGQVKLFKPNGELDGVITRHNVLAKATKLADGKTWYSYGDLDMVGRWASYAARCEDIRNALQVATT